jgi:hypothetical protein
MTQAFIFNNYGVLIDQQLFSQSSISLVFGFLLFVFIAAIPPAIAAFKTANKSHG